MALGLFVTGTDTGVGKTLLSAALLHAFAQRGRKVVGMKPIVAGALLSKDAADGEGVYEDVEALRAASNVRAPPELMNQYRFREPIAPHIAAEHAGVSIDFGVIERAYQQLCAVADVVVVEGVGGFKVPLVREQDSADLVRHLGLPVVLVVGMRLGCLNHALLTQAAIKQAGLRLHGWVANTLDPGMHVFDDNLRTLIERIDALLLGVVPFMLKPDARLAAGCLNLDLPTYSTKSS